MPFFIVPFIHIDLPKKSSEVIALEETIYSKKQDQQKQLIELKRKAVLDSFSLEYFLRKQQELINSFESQNSNNQRALNKLIDDNRVFGFKSLRIFVIGFGTRIVILFLAVVLLLTTFIKSKELISTLRFVAIAFITVGLYLNIWFLWDAQDYPKNYYYSIIGFMSVTGSILTYIFLSKYQLLVNRLTDTIRRLFDFIIIETAEKYVPSNKKDSHQEAYESLIEDVID